MRRPGVFPLLPLLCLALVMAGGAAAEREFALVLKVIDGDTIKVDYNGGRRSIRLIGIDSPECRANDKGHADARRLGRDIVSVMEQGGKARAFVRSLLSPGSVVYLEFDVRKKDRYGRLLAYVYLPDGRMLNEVVVRSGFAGLFTIPPDVRYVKRLRFALHLARKEGRGLWAEGDMPFPDRDRKYAVSAGR